MLYRNHGAFRVVKRQSTVLLGRRKMNFTGTMELALNAMRSVFGRGINSSSQTTTFHSKTVKPAPVLLPPGKSTNPRSQLWDPSQGIVFASASSTAKLTTRGFSTAPVAGRGTPSPEEPFPPLSQDSIHSSGSEWLPSQQTRNSLESEPASVSESAQEPIARAKYDDSDASLIEEKEAVTPLSFAIPAEALESAKKAEAGTAESYWTHKLYTGPEGAKVKVHYCKSLQTAEAVLKKHFVDKPILGFDIEWKPEASKYSGAKKNVSLVQIACEDRIVLAHLALFPKDGPENLVAPTLKKIMEDGNIAKCGVCIKADCTRLKTFLGIDTKGIFELSHMYKLNKYSESGEYGLINKRTVNLAQQALDVLELPLFKGEVRGSDWSEPLSMEQILYAASDAYAGFMIYHKLNEKRLALDPPPPLPYFAEENKPIRLATGVEIVAPEKEDAEEDAPRPLTKDGGAVGQDDGAELEDIEGAAERPVRKARKAEKELEPRVAAATEFAVAYRTQFPKTAASPSQLRAWHIWYHNADLSIDDIAKLLRDPPLQRTTVISYILEALRLEGRGIVGSINWLMPSGSGVSPAANEEDLLANEDNTVAAIAEPDDAASVAQGVDAPQLNLDRRGLDVEKGRLKDLLSSLDKKSTTSWRLKGLIKFAK